MNYPNLASYYDTRLGFASAPAAESLLDVMGRLLNAKPVLSEGMDEDRWPVDKGLCDYTKGFTRDRKCGALLITLIAEWLAQSPDRSWRPVSFPIEGSPVRYWGGHNKYDSNTQYGQERWALVNYVYRRCTLIVQGF